MGRGRIGDAIKRLTVVTIASAGLVAAAGPATHAFAASDELDIAIGGGPLASIEAAPAPLTPPFAASIHDYTVRCQPGTNDVGLRLTSAPGRRLQAGAQSGPSVSLTAPLVENQAAVLEAAGPDGLPQQYWVRCLPHDFPALAISRPGNPSPGWYVTGNAFAGPGASPYAMILDTNGTPVWYQAAPGGAVDVERVSATSVAWSAVLGAPGYGLAPNPGYGIRSLDASSVQRITAVGSPTDHHELLPLPDGNWMLLSYPLKTGVDLTSLGLGTNRTIADCVIQEVDRAGALVWQWRATDHMAVSESMEPVISNLPQGPVYDLFHLNSLESDANGDIMVSEDRLRSVPGIGDINTDVMIRSPQVKIQIDRPRAAALGVAWRQPYRGKRPHCGLCPGGGDLERRGRRAR